MRPVAEPLEAELVAQGLPRCLVGALPTQLLGVRLGELRVEPEAGQRPFRVA